MPDKRVVEVFIEVYSTPTDEGISGGFGVVIIVDGNFFEQFSSVFAHTRNERLWLYGITESIRFLPFDFEPDVINVYLSYDKMVRICNWHIEQLKNGSSPELKWNIDLWNDWCVAIQKVVDKIEFIEADTKNENLINAKRLIDEKWKQGEFIKDKDESALVVENGVDNEVQDIEIESKKHPVLESVSVSSYCEGTYGRMEYRGLDNKTKQPLFKNISFKMGTKNAGDFLAIVHVLALNKREGKEQPIIYSNNVNAIRWVKSKSFRTSLRKNWETEKLYNQLENAVKWLETNEVDFTKIKKWETKIWGNIPAKFKVEFDNKITNAR